MTLLKLENSVWDKTAKDETGKISYIQIKQKEFG